MCLSQTTGYAVLALACMENKQRQRCNIREVAACTGIPKPYLAQILSRLSRQGIVSAKRGYHGGVSLTLPPGEISLLDVVEAVEGKDWLGPCLLGLQNCCKGFVCPTHQFWQDTRRQIELKLRSTTLADVIGAAAGAQRAARGGARRASVAAAQKARKPSSRAASVPAAPPLLKLKTPQLRA